jgi:hypothetical protein
MLFYSKCWISETKMALKLHCTLFPELSASCYALLLLLLLLVDAIIVTDYTASNGGMVDEFERIRKEVA